MTLNLQPTLHSDLLSIGPLKSADLDDLYNVASDPLIWKQHTATDRWKKSVFKNFFDDAIKSEGALIIESQGEIIDSSRFVELSDEAVEIGWTFLARKYWGGKYNNALKTLLINHIFDSLDLVVFHVAKVNIRSQKAVEKLGAHKVFGITYKHLLKDPDTLFTYLLAKENWKG